MFHVENEMTYYSNRFCVAMTYDEPHDLEEYMIDFNPSTTRDSFGDSLLHLNTLYGGHRLVEHFIEIGCDINDRNNNGETPLICAVKYENLVVTEALLVNGADIGLRNKEGKGPLHFCRDINHMEYVKALVKAMRTKNGMDLDDVATMFLEADCPLHVAVFTGNTQLIRMINERRGDVIESSGYTALHAAVDSGNFEAIQCLFELGADFDGILHYAAEQHLAQDDGAGYLEMSRFLLAHGAKVNELDENGRTPLHVVATYGNVATVKMLLDHGAAVLMRDSNNRSVLHFAAENRNGNVLKIFLDYKELDVNERSLQGETPLHVASMWANLPCMKLLLDLNAEVDAVDNLCYTPLNKLIELNDGFMWDRCRHVPEDAIHLLLEHGANVNHPNSRGSSILLNALNVRLHLVLLRHMARLEEIGQPIDQLHEQVIDDYQQLSEYLKECRNELDSMRKQAVFGQVTFLKLLTGDLTTTARYARNHELQMAFFKSEYMRKFPLYGDAMEENFFRGVKRHRRLAAATMKVESCSIPLLPEIIEKILDFVSDQDLENICLC